MTKLQGGYVGKAMPEKRDIKPRLTASIRRVTYAAHWSRNFKRQAVE